MAEPILIIGASGSGKTYACRNFPPEKTLLISVDGKRPPFPLKGWGTMTAENVKGSFYIPKRENPYATLKKATKTAVENGKKIIIVDDSQFLMANEFFARAHEKGYEKFTELGQKFWTLIDFMRDLPDDVTVYFLHHTELDHLGDVKVKTIGKMLDEKGSVEGRFTVCLLAVKEDNAHVIKGSLDNNSIVKSPPDMFPQEPIEGDLALIDTWAREYWGMV